MQPLLNHHFFIIPRGAARGGCPPTPRLISRMFAEINAPFVESSHLRSFFLSFIISFFLSFFLPFSLLLSVYAAPAAKSVPYLAAKWCACHEICTVHCESAAPATKSVLHIAKALPLPQNLHLTLRKCCTYHTPHAKVLRLPRNLRLTLRKFCTCHEICTSIAPATKSVPDLAKVLRLPRT